MVRIWQHLSARDIPFGDYFCWAATSVQWLATACQRSSFLTYVSVHKTCRLVYCTPWNLPGIRDLSRDDCRIAIDPCSYVVPSERRE